MFRPPPATITTPGSAAELYTVLPVNEQKPLVGFSMKIIFPVRLEGQPVA